MSSSIKKADGKIVAQKDLPPTWKSVASVCNRDENTPQDVGLTYQVGLSPAEFKNQGDVQKAVKLLIHEIIAGSSDAPNAQPTGAACPDINAFLKLKYR